MPVLRSGDKMPAWCEMTYFEIVHLRQEKRTALAALAKRKK